MPTNAVDGRNGDGVDQLVGSVFFVLLYRGFQLNFLDFETLFACRKKGALMGLMSDNEQNENQRK